MKMVRRSDEKAFVLNFVGAVHVERPIRATFYQMTRRLNDTLSLMT
jgi:hypothetical protein